MTFDKVYAKLAEGLPEAIVNGRIRLDKYIPRRYAERNYEAVQKACAFLEMLVDEKNETLFDNIICKLYENENAEEIYKYLGAVSRHIWDEYTEYFQITEKLSEYLRSELPSIDIDDDIPYYTAGRYGDYVTGCFKSGSYEEVRRRLLFVEQLVSHENRFISNLGAAGYLEGMFDEATVDSEKFYSLLGENSKAAWRSLIEGWSKL